MKRYSAFVCLLLSACNCAPAQTLNVFAAASLKESFTKVAAQFERTHPGVQVQLNFAGSQRLAAQIKLGAPADVFASAGSEPLKTLSIPLSEWRWFALNRLAVVTPSTNKAIGSLKDLGRPLRLVVADARVPVGDYTEQMLDLATAAYGAAWVAQFRANVVSKEQDVRAVLAKVSLGEVDAGIVYTSDVVAAGAQVRAFPVPAALNPIARYPAIVVPSSSQRRLASLFVDALFNDSSQAALKASGFGSPLDPAPVFLVGQRRIYWRDVLRLPKSTLKATFEEHMPDVYKGVDLRSVLRFSKAPLPPTSVTVAAADGRQLLIQRDWIARGKVLVVPMADGNWEIVAAGGTPNLWIRWIRSLVVN